MAPVRVATGRACLGRTYDVAVEPARDVVMVELLAPQHSSERLPHHCGLIVTRALRGQRCIVLVSFAAPVGVDPLEVCPEVRSLAEPITCQAKPELDRLAGSDFETIPASHFCTMPRRIYRRRTVNDVVVDAVLWIGRLLSGDAIQVPRIGFVFTEQQRRRLSGRIRPGGEAPAAQQFFFNDRADVASFSSRPDNRPRDTSLP